MKIQLTLYTVKAFHLGSGGKGGAPLSLIPGKQIQIDMNNQMDYYDIKTLKYCIKNACLM